MRTRAGLLGSILLSTALACGGCGGAGHPQTPSALTADQIDADPIALLPPSPIAVVDVDARAFYSSDSVGAQVAALSEKAVPLGEEAGFQASRDVDRVVAATYGSEGADAVAVLCGRFDESKITAAAEAHKTTKAGGTITESDYAGHHVFTVAGGGISVLTPKTALAGTQAAIRRALDRVAAVKATRDLSSWMLETLGTPNAAAAAAIDFSQPVTSAALASIPLPAAKGVKTLRAVADFKPPGMHVALTLEYADAATASAAASSLKQAVSLEGLAALTGLVPKLQQVAIASADANVQASFAVDETAMKKLAVLLPQLANSATVGAK
jgi:hypothetical protein